MDSATDGELGTRDGRLQTTLLDVADGEADPVVGPVDDEVATLGGHAERVERVDLLAQAAHD